MHDWQRRSNESVTTDDGPSPGKSTRSGQIQRRASGAAGDPEAALAQAQGSTGQPLAAPVQARFEQSLGTDLSGVRLHSGGGSAAAAAELGARAFTTGNDVHLGAGESVDNPFGMHLLAHEVAHTVQQRGGTGVQTKLTVSEPGDALEQEADAAADRMVAGQPATVSGGGAGAVQRKEGGGHATVRLGSTGPDVQALQQQLDSKGYACSTDGQFGPKTRAAVIAFQADHGLGADGVVGPMTWAALDGAAAAPTPAAPAGGDHGETPAAPAPAQPAPATSSGAAPAGGATQGATPAAAGGQVEPAGAAVPGAGSIAPAAGTDPRAGLLAGKYADAGAYRPAGDGFTNADLDAQLDALGALWGVDVRAKPGAPEASAGGSPYAGDSAGKGVKSHPPWVKAFQNKLIGKAKWGDDERATQRVVEAYLRAWAVAGTGQLAPGAEQMMLQVGASEGNGQAENLGGWKGGSNWCAQASTSGLIYGLYNRGLRFKDSTHSSKYVVEMGKQTNRYIAWYQAQNAHGKVLAGKTAHNAQLEPGDIISIVNGGPAGPLSGHVATVVRHEGESLVYISGNASGVVASEGAVRIEEVKREIPPDGFVWMAPGNPKERGQAPPGKYAPAEAGVSWVVTVIKASALTKIQAMADGAVQVEPADPAIERGPRLAEQCPDTPAQMVNHAGSTEANGPTP